MPGTDILIQTDAHPSRTTAAAPKQHRRDQRDSAVDSEYQRSLSKSLNDPDPRKSPAVRTEAPDSVAAEGHAVAVEHPEASARTGGPDEPPSRSGEQGEISQHDGDSTDADAVSIESPPGVQFIAPTFANLVLERKADADQLEFQIEVQAVEGAPPAQFRLPEFVDVNAYGSEVPASVPDEQIIPLPPVNLQLLHEAVPSQDDGLFLDPPEIPIDVPPPLPPAGLFNTEIVSEDNVLPDVFVRGLQEQIIVGETAEPAALQQAPQLQPLTESDSSLEVQTNSDVQPNFEAPVDLPSVEIESNAGIVPEDKTKSPSFEVAGAEADFPVPQSESHLPQQANESAQAAVAKQTPVVAASAPNTPDESSNPDEASNPHEAKPEAASYGLETAETARNQQKPRAVDVAASDVPEQTPANPSIEPGNPSVPVARPTTADRPDTTPNRQQNPSSEKRTEPEPQTPSVPEHAVAFGLQEVRDQAHQSPRDLGTRGAPQSSVPAEIEAPTSPPPQSAAPVINASPEGRATPEPVNASATATTSPDVDPAEFIDRVTSAIRLSQRDGGRLRIRLNPPELGTLQIDVTSLGGTISAQLEVQTAAARQVILDNISQLHEALAQNGTVVARIDVEVASQWNDDGESPDFSENADENLQQEHSDSEHEHDTHDANDTNEEGDSQAETSSTPLGMDQLDIQI